MSEIAPTHTGSPLGVCVLPAPPRNAPCTCRHPEYVHELLGHAGLCYEALSLEDLPGALDRLRVLVTIGEHPLPDEVRAWVEAGGAWLGVAGLCGMGGLLGAVPRQPEYSLWGGALRVLGEGYLDARGSDHPVLRDVPIPLHFFNGVSVTAEGANVLATGLDAHGRPSDSSLILERGRCLLIAPDITGTVVHVQQGLPVVRDGVPAPDGTGPVSDGVLKTDDGQVLDWLLDRQPVPNVPGLSAFLEPVADCWRDLLLRAILYLASEQGVSLPLLWFYPEGRAALGHLSHDTDGNDPEKARGLLRALREAEAPATWCVILPGYDPALISEIREAGHELATHFDALSRPWNEEEFDRQWRDLRALFGEQPVTNKNHYLRWEGDTEFFEWCAARGIRMDQSKGASKTGEAGFNFGTCHPYRPLTASGSLLSVLELPTPTQDLHVFAPEELVAPLLSAVMRHYGILHLLFHPAHVEKPNVAESLIRSVRRGREAGMDWWTARQIEAWEEARRAARWSGYAAGPNGCSVELSAPQALPGATILWLVPKDSGVGDVERWGFGFQTTLVDIAAGAAARLETGL